MIIVIDAYNVLKQVGATGDISQHERNRFISQLGAYARLKKHAIVLVFDGGEHEWLYKENQAGIQVVYSGAHQTADHYIADYIATQQGKEIVLVSSDRELNSRVDDMGVPSIGAPDFYDILQATLRDSGLRDSAAAYAAPKKQVQLVKMHKDSSPELDALMEEAAQGVVTKKEDSHLVAHGGQKKATRTDRQLLKILKKL